MSIQCLPISTIKNLKSFVQSDDAQLYLQYLKRNRLLGVEVIVTYITFRSNQTSFQPSRLKVIHFHFINHRGRHDYFCDGPPLPIQSHTSYPILLANGQNRFFASVLFKTCLRKSNKMQIYLQKLRIKLKKSETILAVANLRTQCSFTCWLHSTSC